VGSVQKQPDTSAPKASRPHAHRLVFGPALPIDYVIRIAMASVLFIAPHLLLCCMDGSLWSTSASPLIALTYASALALVAMIFRMPSAFLFVLAVPSMVYTAYIVKQGRSLNHNDIAAVMNTTLSETTDFVFGTEILVPMLLLLFVWAGLIVVVAIRWTLLSRVLRKLKCIRLSDRAYRVHLAPPGAAHQKINPHPRPSISANQNTTASLSSDAGWSDAADGRDLYPHNSTLCAGKTLSGEYARQYPSHAGPDFRGAG
jgi:hypothetical protein